ncbi:MULTISPECIES: nuclear transport factor 2 family protein [Novosphingobium]|uniref:nuclear transport factor 2 family protein n=1 Tax=Novosphingobium TaxID=165696 RepID=UPI001CD29691|nr:nuclear transport factor 2 family protein [Novosphingobium percolationis]
MAHADIERRLRRIEACEEIRRLVATYAVGADRKNDPEVLGPLFASDAQWVLDGVAHLIGREAIAAGLSELARSFVTWSMHYMVSPLIEVAADGLHATCRWYLWELATMKQADGSLADTWYGGWYDSALSLHEGAWLFDHVRLVPRIASPAGEAWTGKVPAV